MDLRNLAVNVAFAWFVGVGAMLFFFLVGLRATLDQRLFLRVHAAVERLFGFVGAYVLFLAAVEVLNPEDLTSLTQSPRITYKPPFLAQKFLEVEIQDWVIVGILLLLVVNMLIRALSYAKHVPKLPVGADGRSEDSQLVQDTVRNLDFPLNFSARAWLIGVLAPALITSFREAVGLVVVLGLLLIAGAYCFLESMRLGAVYAHVGSARRVLIRRVPQLLALSLLRYEIIAVLGYVFFVVVPGMVHRF